MYVFEIILFSKDILHKSKVWQCLGGITITFVFLLSLLDYCLASYTYNWKGVAIYMTSPTLFEPLLLSRKNWSLHESAVSFSLQAARCMTSFGYHFPVVYRTSKFSSTRHRKSQPFRET